MWKPPAVGRVHVCVCTAESPDLKTFGMSLIHVCVSWCVPVEMEKERV